MRQEVDAGMANSVNPDQEQSDLGLYLLPRPVCPKTKVRRDVVFTRNYFFI